ncbi:hypothetical protein Y032_0001g304 [Ancylostoma ceylanicum]|uniref:Uncharacterized protein n=1 Tax=Ancylostoma ceylanicum TaxID=53326 RepID=A0A016W4I4_9BILA|nr:hypothetical protein Y032_0001g304 [Ancylostoma ceylanicum]
MITPSTPYIQGVATIRGQTERGKRTGRLPRAVDSTGPTAQFQTPPSPAATSLATSPLMIYLYVHSYIATHLRAYYRRNLYYSGVFSVPGR